MKNQIIKFTLSLVIAFFVIGCELLPKEINALKNLRRSSLAERVVLFDRNASQADIDASIQTIQDELNDDFGVQKCDCSANLYLFSGDIVEQINPSRGTHLSRVSGPDIDLPVNIVVDYNTSFNKLDVAFSPDGDSTSFDTTYKYNDDNNPTLIGVFDTGLGVQNNRLLGNSHLSIDPAMIDYTKSWNAMTNGNTIADNDPDSHGTKVTAFLIAQLQKLKANNFKIVPYTIFDAAGVATLFNTLCAMEKAYDDKIQVMNLSFGYYPNQMNNPNPNSGLLFETVIDDLAYPHPTHSGNTILIAAAGNGLAGNPIDIETWDTNFIPGIFSSSSQYQFIKNHVITTTSLKIDYSNSIPISSMYNYSERLVDVGVATRSGGFINPSSIGLTPTYISGTSFCVPIVAAHIVNWINQNNLSVYNKVHFFEFCIRNNTVNFGGNSVVANKCIGCPQ